MSEESTDQSAQRRAKLAELRARGRAYPNDFRRDAEAGALRFGFTYEGRFRRAVIIRNRSRDTAWFAMIDEEWPALKAAFERWLAPENFDARGRQRTRLSELTSAALASLR